MSVKIFIPFLISIFCIDFVQSQDKKYSISGYVKELGSSELLPGVTVYLPSKNIGTTTNSYGFYSITLAEEDTVALNFSFLGYATEVRKISLHSNVVLDIFLDPASDVLEEVVIQKERAQERIAETPQMSHVDIPIKQIKAIPALFGEKDVLKVLQLMPGVQKGTEGTSGLYVRGGGPDQNLIILDDATVYNANHLFGFFSVFNGDALKSVELYKGGFPARFGGRLSSVIEMSMKEGNKEKLAGEFGVGLISSRLTLEGPLVKNKASFLISARRTYIDALIYPLLPQESKFGYNFYDLNAKVNYDFGRNNKIYLSGYFGRDKFFARFSENQEKFSSGILWGNGTSTLRWNHLFSNKLFANTSLVFSNFRFKIFAENESPDQNLSLQYYSGIRDFSLKHDIDFLPNPQHSIKAGVLLTHHTFTPSAVVAEVGESKERIISELKAIESAVYVEDLFKPTNRIFINGGFRISNFTTQGKTYFNPEPRLSASYKVKENVAVKGSFATMNQYLHLLSNTSIGLPTDLWVPATKNVQPQRSNQVAAGVVRDFTKGNFSMSLEGYYKKSNNVIGYKEGASFLMLGDPSNGNEVSWEKNVASGNAWSYGAEFLLQKKYGRFSGWIGYTLSWTQMQFDSINKGKKFYAKYDRRHDISLVGIYRISDQVTLSSTWVYGSGNAITLPIGSYNTNPHQIYSGNTNDNNVTEFSERNAFRMASYHRMDISLQLHRELSWGGERTWEISLYNAYSRRNPFFYFIDTEYNQSNNTSRNVLKQVSLFPILPSISYSLKF